MLFPNIAEGKLCILYMVSSVFVSQLSDGNNQATAPSLNDEGELKLNELFLMKLELSSAGPLTINNWWK